ncbi:hypothetical protein C8Q75DRAFT_793843 [Abortiporus biennis]|nr:hypothetical protein C8Q75DRAFT_793843 [Abortiporus biennis]
MIKSGKLAKYPLVFLSKALDTLNPNSLSAYDIGCSFSSTVKWSSLGNTFKEKNFTLCVNAFYGYTHNCQCQLWIRLEDLEIMECIFSASNHLASVIQYASPFHRQKYTNSGTFLYNNICQSQKIIEKDTYALQDAMTSLQIMDSDLNHWEKEEVVYFLTFRKEDPENTHAITYVELLNELYKLESQWNNTTTSFINSVSNDFIFVSDGPPTLPSYAANAAATVQLECNRRLALEQYNRVLADVIKLEVHLNIPHHWMHASSEYLQTIKYITEHKYHKALDNL